MRILQTLEDIAGALTVAALFWVLTILDLIL